MNLAIEQAPPEASRALCEVLKESPMEGAISITMERDPDYFAAAHVQAESPHVFYGKDLNSHKIVGTGSCGYRKVFLEGRSRQVAYLSDLRIRKEFRNSRALFKAYQYLKNLSWVEHEIAQTIVVNDNQNALDILTSGRAGLPRYFSCGEYESPTIFLNKPKLELKTSLTIRQAEAEDKQAMQAFLNTHGPQKNFFPAYDFSQIGHSSYYKDLNISDYFLLLEEDRIKGMLGVWDQSAFKQVRVIRYNTWLKYSRSLINLFSPFRGGFKLPREGNTIPHFYLHTVVMENNSPHFFSILLRHIYNRFCDSPFQYFITGFDRTDPLLGVLKTYAHQKFGGRHFLVTYGRDPRDSLTKKHFYLEAGRI